MKKVTFGDLEKCKTWKTAVIVFTEDSFKKKYSLKERSYEVSSDAKLFNDQMLGNSLFGTCLDGTEVGVRLDQYMKLEKNRWEVEYCYVVN